jgi:hypothetical protein
MPVTANRFFSWPVLLATMPALERITNLGLTSRHVAKVP